MKTAPDPKDVQEFQFKQSNTSQIIDAFTSIPIACSLLAADKKRGLLYIGQNNRLIILKPGEDSDPEWKIEVEISIIVSKLMLSCDCSYLAIIPHGPFVLVYDVQALVRGSLQLLHEIRISTTANAFVSDLQWNPTVPGMLCTVASDYTVGSFHIKEDKERTIELKALERLNGLDVLCTAWSPKGKQIVVGCKSGHIVQLKPDLKVARTIPGPAPYIGEVISILWISNYQFCAAYLGSEQRINVLIVDAPKGEANAIFTCYEDITYGITETEDGTIPRYYFDHVPEWGLIIAASGNSSEIAVLGSTDGGATWNQWQLVDSGRAELPLICTTESYPVGLAIDKSSSRKLPWGAESTLPHPVPVLHILATSGQLCSFHMVNLFPNCPAINVPPTEIISTPPHPRASILPTETSIIMNGLVTSTPRPKQQENVAERPKPAPTGNIFDKLLKGTGGFFSQPPAEKPKQQEQKPEICNMEIKVEPPKEIHPVEPVKPDVKLTPIKETVPQPPVEPKTTVEDDSRDIRAYIEEHNLFEKELRNRLEPQTWIECGTEDERRKLAETSAIIDHFLRELRETTNSLSSDIAYLKALLLQSFAWVEETKSKNAASNDITARNCGDSNKISDLQKLYYYTQTQLTQASKIVDLEWLDIKSHEMSRMRIPHLEFVYQNLILHNKIIQEEKNKVEQLKKRWKLITRSNSMFGLNRSLSNLSVSSSKSSASLPRNAGIIEARCKAIASKTLSFTQGKQVKLRKYLSASAPRVIKPVNPSPIQHRLEATLSSLASLSTSTATTDIIASATTVDAKTKLEQTTSKQTPVAKQATEKLKQQSPLASLNVIVARIGANETNNMSAQSKPQASQPSFTNTFPVATGNKPMQLEKKSSLPVTTAAHQSAKPKQDTIIFNQVNPSALPNLMKSFPVVSIPSGTPMQNSEETIQKSIFTESVIKAGKEIVQNTSPFKVESNLFGTGALKGALPPETSAGKVQGITSSTSLTFGVAITTAVASTNESATTFSFATPIIASTTTKSISQAVTPQTTIAQSFSFASKPSSPATILNWKLPSTTAAPQTQGSMNMMGLISGLQAPIQTPVSSSEINVDDKSKSKFILVTPTFEMSLGQAQPASSPVIVSAGTKQTVTTISSSSAEEVSSTTESKVPSFPTSSAPSLPVTSAARLFANQTNAPSIPIFGEASSSTPTASTFTATTSSNAFGGQTATTSSMSIFGGFSSPLATSLTSTATTASTVSPFQTALSKPTFGATATSLSTPSSVSASTSASPTLNFGSITTATTAASPNATTTTTATSVFGKPALPMTTQFSTAPAVSSAADAFGKSVISPASMPFGSSANTSIFGGTPTTTAKASFFSGGNTSSIFGANTQASSSGNIFGGNTSPVNTFATPQKSVFDNTQKSGSIFGGTSYTTGSFFGGTPPTNTSAGVTTPGSPSVFGNVGASTSPLGMEQPVLGGQTAFGQAPSFDSKPVFASPPGFGASKPVFGGGFGGTAFGASAAPPAFGSPPTMGASPAPLDNNASTVFGNMGSSNTFESLASQSGGLSFSSLAQKSPEAEKPPVFTGGSSFSSWR